MSGKYWVCRDCLVAHVNGVEIALNESAIWDSAWDCGRYLESVAGLNLAYDIDPETENGINTFSRSACELCGSRQAGERFRLALVGSSGWTRERVLSSFSVGCALAYFDEERAEDIYSEETVYSLIVCPSCARNMYGADVSEFTPITVGDLLDSDNSDPANWVCQRCPVNVLDYVVKDGVL